MIDLPFLRRLAEDAIDSGPNKWLANQELISWFRSDPVAVIEALQAAQTVRICPGGRANQKLYAALDRLPPGNHNG
jgi:hypothetical protein